jgi:F0F1-type ATP synthase assembly protein I
MYFLLKTIVSALVIGIITILAKYSPKYGGIIAALPLVNLLSLFWLHMQGEKSTELSQFLFGVLYGLPATFVLVLIAALSLKHSVPFLFSIGLGVIGWTCLLFIQKVLLPN